MFNFRDRVTNLPEIGDGFESAEISTGCIWTAFCYMTSNKTTSQSVVVCQRPPMPPKGVLVKPLPYGRDKLTMRPIP